MSDQDRDARPDGDALDDAEVIARVLAGDTDRFADLVQRYQAVLYRHAVSIVLDHDAAADMVQDAFVRAYTSLRECRDRTRFRAWLFQTLRNRCLDYLKDTRRRHVSLDDAGPLFDPGESPASAAERNRLRTEVEQALARLPAEQREAFVMHYVDGMPYDAMAELLDVSVSALKMRALRAREALSASLRQTNVTVARPASSLYQAR